MDQKFFELGAISIIFLFCAREFFMYLRQKKTTKDNGSDKSVSEKIGHDILGEIQLMNSNHLKTLQESVERGNERLVDVIHSDNTAIIEILAEIKGRLSK